MIRILIVLVLLGSGASLWAEDGSVSTEPKPSDAVSQKEPQSQDQPAPTIWPRPFQPSQEIGADSQISFPTDI